MDSASLFDLHNHLSTKRLKNALKMLAQRKQLKIPEGVYRELKRKSRKPYLTIKNLIQYYPDLLVPVTKVHNLQSELARIEQIYGETIQIGARKLPGLWRSRSGRKAEDGQVVALAKKLGAMTVSNDKAIQRACFLENVPCIGWTEFARKISFSQQMRLF